MKTNMNSKNYFSILLASALAFCGNAAWAKTAVDQVEIELAKIFDCNNSATVVEVITNDVGEIVGHKVILGKDYGPIALSNDFGAVTIDLNGWAIRGKDGAVDTDATAGRSGGAAITVAGECGVEPASDTTITVCDDSCVQLWEGGPYFATRNVGATNPEDDGYYFWWGDTVGALRNTTDDGWASAEDGSDFVFSSANCPTFRKEIEALKTLDDGNSYIDVNSNLVAKFDAATAHWGAPWRMMTDVELQNLVDDQHFGL